MMAARQEVAPETRIEAESLELIGNAWRPWSRLNQTLGMGSPNTRRKEAWRTFLGLRERRLGAKVTPQEIHASPSPAVAL
jgi:hypothetical protein